MTIRGDAQPAERVDYAAAGVTAGAALLAGFMVLARGADEGVLATAAVVIGIGSLALIVLANRSTGGDRLGWLQGPDGIAATLARPVAWLGGVLALLVVATLLLPTLQLPWLTKDNILAVGLVVFLIVAVAGWGPAASRAWPSGLRLSTLTVVGTLVAVALVGVYLYFLVGMRDQAVTAVTDAQWTRLVELRSTLEALAFAAAGAILGQTVGRGTSAVQVNEANKTAAVANDTATSAANSAIDKLTAASVPPEDVKPSTVSSVGLPADKDAAIREALAVLTAAREQIRRNSSGQPNPTLADF